MKIQRMAAVICIAMLLCLLAVPALANSAEPPGLIIIVNSPPEDLKLFLRFEDSSLHAPIELIKTQKAWEAQYRFHYWSSPTRPSLSDVTLIAQSGATYFEYPFPEQSLQQYANIYTLDIKNKDVVSGLTPLRTITLVGMRLLLTLLLEGAVFYAFGFRSKRSWLVFFIVNIITQGALNIALNGSLAEGYLLLALGFYEVLILVVESVAFASLIKEHKKGKVIGCVVLMNILSLVLGGILLSYLPV